MSVLSDAVVRVEQAFAEVPVSSSWLQGFRQQAFEDFLGQGGFPSRKTENWKYTSVKDVVEHDFRWLAPAANEASFASVQKPVLAGLDCVDLVFVDGVFVEGLSSSLPAGLSVEALSSASKSIQSGLGQGVDQGRHPFAALNGAFLRDGVVVCVDVNVQLSSPVRLLYLASQVDCVAVPRVVFVAGALSEVCVIEHFEQAFAGRYLSNSVTEFSVGVGAQVSFFQLQGEEHSLQSVSNVCVLQQKDSVFNSCCLLFGGSLARFDLKVRLLGENAQCHLSGLYLAGQGSHLDNHTDIHHVVPHCSSREVYKGILAGGSRAVFNGRIEVYPDAQKSDAALTNHNLLLAEDAEVDTKPELEIYADDVKCSHGTTVGQLDKSALFYLRSRGLCEKEALKVLTFAFANEIVESVGVEDVRVWAGAQLGRWLEMQSDVVG